MVVICWTISKSSGGRKRTRTGVYQKAAAKAPPKDSIRGESFKGPVAKQFRDDGYAASHPVCPCGQLSSPHGSTNSNADEDSNMVHSPTTSNILNEHWKHKDVTIMGKKVLDELCNEAFWLEISVEELLERKKRSKPSNDAESSTVGQKRNKEVEETEESLQDQGEEKPCQCYSGDIFDSTKQSKSKKGKERAIILKKDGERMSEPHKKRQKTTGDSNAEKAGLKDTEENAEVKNDNIKDITANEDIQRESENGNEVIKKESQPKGQKKDREADGDDYDYGGVSQPKKKYRRRTI